MGCDTCKKEKQKTKQKDIVTEDNYIKLLPDSVANGNFGELNILLKIVVFSVLLLAVPLVISVLIIQLFFQFFFPSKLIILQKKVTNWGKNLLHKYGSYIARKRIEKREKEFATTTVYKSENYQPQEDMEFEVYENNEETKE